MSFLSDAHGRTAVARSGSGATHRSIRRLGEPSLTGAPTWSAAALGLVGVVTGSGLAVALALVWFAHIGMDRALGLGLLYPDGSGCTHLKRPRPDRKGAGLGGGSWTG
jgi:Domain of unknown function (DUF4260)